MTPRPRALLTAAATLALALTPAIAAAQSSTIPRVTVHGGHAAAAPAVTYHSVAPHTTDGITPAISCTPSNARTVSCDATASSDTASTITGYTFDFGAGGTATTNTTGTVTYTYATPGAYTVTLTVSDAAGNSATDTESVTTNGSDYTPFGPTRILDTRNGTGQGGTAAKVGSDATLKLQISGTDAIPADVTAVVINLTVAGAAANGVITAYPDDGTNHHPTTSNLNYLAANGPTAALATVAVGTDGAIDLYNNSTGSTDLIGDVAGYFTTTAASGFTPLSPDRILDTRTTIGNHNTPLAANGSLALTVAGADGGDLPSSGITAVAVNLTTTGETQIGDLIAYADGATRPAASSLDYRAGANIANYAVVPVGADGKIDIYNESSGTTNVVVDVTGYFSANSTSSYVPVVPTRSLDTRSLPAGTVCAECIAQDQQLTSTINSATAYAVTATVISPAASGNLIIYPAGAPIPTASNINWTAGETIANSTYAIPSSTGIYLYNQSSGNMNVVVDEYGYYANS